MLDYLVEHGLTIRAISKISKSTFKNLKTKEFETIEEKNSLGGKFLVSKNTHQDSMIRFKKENIFSKEEIEEKIKNRTLHKEIF